MKEIETGRIIRTVVVGDTLLIGENVEIYIAKKQGSQMRVCVTAPRGQGLISFRSENAFLYFTRWVKEVGVKKAEELIGPEIYEWLNDKAIPKELRGRVMRIMKENGLILGAKKGVYKNE